MYENRGFRTDLALERNEILEEGKLGAIKTEEYFKDKVKVTRMEIMNEEEAELLGKPIGTYITAEVPSFATDAEVFDGRLEVIADEIRSLLPKDGLVLIAGLGNELITPDALGPKCIDFVLATRHISKELAEAIGLTGLRAVAGIAPGVLGQTGIETGEIIAGISKNIRPCAVITVDALASRKLSRLGRTVQISDTGITPGSGIGNSRKSINRELLGVDVISIGVPTVVDGETLAYDLLGEELVSKKDVREIISPEGKKMVVTPREIDLMIERSSRLVGMAINRALHPEIPCEDILSLVT